MVRLGKDSEAQQQRLLSVQQGYEDRIVQLESRLMQSEQYLTQNDRKGEANQGVFTDLIDKLGSRVRQIEQLQDNLKQEVGRGKDDFGRMELMNLRNNEEFKGVVGSLQTEFGQKLEVRMTELVNKMMQE